MEISKCYKIGLILRPHGLKGEVTFSIDPDAPALEELESVFLEINNRLIPYFIQSISVRGDKAFVKFEDVDSPETAKEISRAAAYLPKASREKSGRNAFYDDEVIGFEVTDANAGAIGSVREVTSAGPNKLLAVDHEGKEVLIPVNSPFITSINKSKKKISVDLPDGFLDL